MKHEYDYRQVRTKGFGEGQTPWRYAVYNGREYSCAGYSTEEEMVKAVMVLAIADEYGDNLEDFLEAWAVYKSPAPAPTVEDIIADGVRYRDMYDASDYETEHMLVVVLCEAEDMIIS